MTGSSHPNDADDQLPLDTTSVSEAWILGQLHLYITHAHTSDHFMAIFHIYLASWWSKNHKVTFEIAAVAFLHA